MYMHILRRERERKRERERERERWISLSPPPSQSLEYVEKVDKSDTKLFKQIRKKINFFFSFSGTFSFSRLSRDGYGKLSVKLDEPPQTHDLARPLASISQQKSTKPETKSQHPDQQRKKQLFEQNHPVLPPEEEDLSDISSCGK